MDPFQIKLRFGYQTNQSILNLVGKIDTFKGKWNAEQQRENAHLKKLRKIAAIESIRSSTKIEGAQLTNDEIKKLLKNLDVSKLKTKDQQEAIGYFEVLENGMKSSSSFQFKKNYIQQLHESLLKYSVADAEHRGNYKRHPNRVVSNNPDGSKRVIFNTTEPHLVASEMNQLINWTNQHLSSDSLHPLIIIGLFNYEFLSIHPFQDGNGPLSRILTNRLLIKSGYKFIQYISFENLIEQKKNEYFEALKDGQKDRYSYEERVDKWIIFFLQSLVTLTNRLEQKQYAAIKSKGSYLNERQTEIQIFVKKNQPIKLADLFVGMNDISINTLKKDLQYLKSEKIIDAIGRNKGTVYLLNVN